MNVNDVKRSEIWRNSVEPGMTLLVLGMYALVASQLTNPMLARSEESSITSVQSSADQNKAPDSKQPAKLEKDPSFAQSSSQEAKPAQLKSHTTKNDEPKIKKDNGEEGTEKEGAGRKAVSSLILTVKLALLADPRLFPYEIEVEGGSEEVTLTGKVPSETERIAAAKIAGAVPRVKSVINKLEVNKELPEVLAHKQDDIITHHVKERFAKSATVMAARFEVKTEQGVVSLSGTVRFQVIVLEAAETARQVPGVKAVKTDKVRIESEG